MQIRLYFREIDCQKLYKLELKLLGLGDFKFWEKCQIENDNFWEIMTTFKILENTIKIQHDSYYQYIL